MADITMCKGEYCELRETCKRYTSQPNEYRQAYFSKEPNVDSYHCDMYWGNKQEQVFNQLKDITNGTN